MPVCTSSLGLSPNHLTPLSPLPYPPLRPPLSQRLLQHPSDDLLPPQLLRKYIAYARQYCHPRLSDAAREVLQAFYLHLRQQAAPGSSTPVTVGVTVGSRGYG